MENAFEDFQRKENESLGSAMNRFEFLIRRLNNCDPDVDKIVEQQCKRKVCQLAKPEAQLFLEREEGRLHGQGFEPTFAHRLNILTREESIIDGRTKKEESGHKINCMMKAPGHARDSSPHGPNKHQAYTDGNYDSLEEQRHRQYTKKAKYDNVIDGYGNRYRENEHYSSGHHGSGHYLSLIHI